MSQSPETAVRLQRYEDGWEIINRLIREDYSWGGNERKCFHVACDDGSFADISHASGLDFLGDGRALAILDVDLDGRPDMVLRNRDAPQLRILRNEWTHAGRAVWIRLEGTASNRDAIGARVTIEAGGGRKVKEVQAGSLFLSQSSRWLPFGLGHDVSEVRAEVRWPGGRFQPLGVLKAGFRYRVKEGAEPVPEPVRDPPPLLAAASADPPPAPGIGGGTWLIDPIAAPGFELARIGGSPGEKYGPAGLRGKPLFLHFLSPSCNVCIAEAPDMLRTEKLIRSAGARMIHIIADPRNEAAGPELVARAKLTEPAVRADGATLAAYDILHRHLWNRRRGLAVPATFLLDENGLVVKVYRGSAAAEQLASDAGRIPRTTAERLKAALLFEGVFHEPHFQRDYLGLGNAFFEAGLDELARATFRGSLEDRSDDVDSLFNYALTSAQAGNAAEAEKAYRKALQLAPGLDDAQNNLGTLLARQGRIGEARELFTAIVARNPAHAEAALNLGNMHLQEGRPELAAQVYRDALRIDPESAPFHRNLGNALFRSNDIGGALEAYRRSLEIDPLDPEGYLGLAILLIASGDGGQAKVIALAGLERAPDNAHLWNALGMAHAGAGEGADARSALLRAMSLDRTFDRPYLNLARMLAGEGKANEAREVLRQLLEAVPEHPAAREMMAQMGSE